MTKKKLEEIRSPFLDGMVITVDKPLGWTSFDLVNKFRYILTRKLQKKKVKVGHAGTLDPLASGVVLLCTGKATKRIEELQNHIKIYTATIRLGATTPSFDLESEVDGTYPTEHIEREHIEEVLRGLEGWIDQVPPVFSACKVEGRRAYDYARNGEELTLAAKRIFIEKIELLRYDAPELVIRVTCGKGTYIRALARDIGEALHSGAHLTALRRDAVGGYTLDGALEPEQFVSFIETNMLYPEDVIPSDTSND